MIVSLQRSMTNNGNSFRSHRNAKRRGCTKLCPFGIDAYSTRFA
jgi:hypothetical protein